MMKTSLYFSRFCLRIFAGCLVFVSFVVLGCASAGKPQLHVTRHLIDYPAPVFEKRPLIEDAIRIDRFTIAAPYNSREMVFRPDGYTVDSFNYNKWAVNPADMVAERLLGDMRSSGLFHAVFSRYAVEEGRYVLQGGVEEFFLCVDKKPPLAVVSMTITLKDTKQRETLKRILFQRKYREEQALETRSPEGFCKAMGLAVERISRRIIGDVYRAAETASLR